MSRIITETTPVVSVIKKKIEKLEAEHSVKVEKVAREWIKVAALAYKYQQQRKKIEKLERDALANLKSMSGDHNMSAGGYFFVRTERIGSVDYSQIPELKNVNIEKYRKPKVFVWSLTKEKK